MSKLDEAVDAALAAAWKQTDPNGGIYQEMDMKAAIQAAVKVLVPDAKDPRRFKEDEYIYRAEGFDACRAEALKNAGIK